MKRCSERKILAKDKMQVAVENFKQAELEGAEEIAPITYRWAKVKIYVNRKKILNPKSNEIELEEAADEASAAAAQLLNAVREHAKKEDLAKQFIPDLAEEVAVENLINEGGPPL